MYTTLQTPEKRPCVFCSAELLSEMVEKRTVEKVLIQPEKRNFQEPSPTRPPISTIRNLVAMPKLITEKPHYAQMFGLTTTTSRRVLTELFKM